MTQELQLFEPQEIFRMVREVVDAAASQPQAEVGLTVPLVMPSLTEAEKTYKARVRFVIRPTVQAVVYNEHGEIIDRSEAICAPQDEFDFWTGVKVAFAKLLATNSKGMEQTEKLEEVKRELWKQLVARGKEQGWHGKGD